MKSVHDFPIIAINIIMIILILDYQLQQNIIKQIIRIIMIDYLPVVNLGANLLVISIYTLFKTG